AVRFIETTGRWADVDLFSEEDAWVFLQELLDEFARRNGKLSDGQIIALRNLGAAMGMRPGTPLSTYPGAVERNFGPGPMGAADFSILIRWLHAQVNGGGDFEPARRPPVSIDGSMLPGEKRGGNK